MSKEDEIKITTRGANGRKQTVCVESFVIQLLDGRDINRGLAESAQATSDNCAEAIAKIVTKLAEKSVINADDVVSIAGGYPAFFKEPRNVSIISVFIVISKPKGCPVHDVEIMSVHQTIAGAVEAVERLINEEFIDLEIKRPINWDEVGERCNLYIEEKLVEL